MRCTNVSSSDDRLDCRDMFYDPLNPLPPKCGACGFPNLDFVPQPYFLVKSRTMAPNEMALAENGNLLVRDRIRRVLEILAPKQCEFFPTHFNETLEETPWSLAMPVHQVTVANVKSFITRCPVCGEPHSAHPGSQYSEWLWNSASEYDVLKSFTWGSSEQGWNKWTFRYCYLSVRLFYLLKGIGARGLYETTCGRVTLPNEEEKKWVRDSLAILGEHHIAFNAPGTMSGEDVQWFRAYIKQHGSKANLSYDVKSLEKQLRFSLPKSY